MTISSAGAGRLPFLASVLLIGLSIFIQLRLEETAGVPRAAGGGTAALRRPGDAAGRSSAASIRRRPRNCSPQEKRQSPALEALRRYPAPDPHRRRHLHRHAGLYYTLVSFSLAYGTNPAGGGMATSTMLAAVLAGAVAMVPGVFVGARLSDRVGRRGVIIASALLLAGCIVRDLPADRQRRACSSPRLASASASSSTA